jgi:hypothetical protein
MRNALIQPIIIYFEAVLPRASKALTVHSEVLRALRVSNWLLYQRRSRVLYTTSKSRLRKIFPNTSIPSQCFAFPENS